MSTLVVQDADRREIFTRLKRAEHEAREGVIDVARRLIFCSNEDWTHFMPLLRHAMRVLRRTELELEAHQKG